MRTFAGIVAAAVVALFAGQALAELGSNNPPDDQLLTQRAQEGGCDTTTSPPTCPPNASNLFDSGTFDVAVPGSSQTYRPAQRVRRDKFGVVGPFMLSNGLQLKDLDNLVYPGTSASDEAQLLEGVVFFTMFHTPGQGGAPNENGVGPINNQPACIGCHLNAADAVASKGLLRGLPCVPPNAPASTSSTCSNVSNVTRAARSTPTNFEFTSLNPATGGGVAPDNLDAISNTGKTAAFTTFGDFSSTLLDTAPGSIGAFDPLDGAAHTFTALSITSQPFGGMVQHHRPAVDACYPKPLPPVSFDTNLTGSNPNQFRRSVGERAGPPYIGRGLIEAVPTDDITANADPTVENGKSSLGSFANLLCPSASSTGCISGAPNMVPRNFSVNTITSPVAGETITGFVGGVGRFGLRANGVEILQFVDGGLQGELSFAYSLFPNEITFPTLFPGGAMEATEPLECAMALSETFGQPASVLPPPLIPMPVDISKFEVHLSTPFSIRNLIRNTAPPEFGDAFLDVLRSAIGGKPLLQNVSWQPDSEEAKVKRGAELFGIDLVAFANRTIGGPMMAGGDGRDDNAINQTDRQLNCVGCHTPIQRTGQSPATLPDDVGAEHLSFVWAPIFSDILLHHMPVVDAERFLQSPGNLPRDPLVIRRLAANFRFSDTFDVPRNLADDTFNNQKASAEGSQFRTAPLMGLGRIGPPFLHDARVYLSEYTVNGSASSTGTAPAGTVTTNKQQTNAPLIVNSVDNAILAAIELHDLPAPDDRNTPRLPGAGCPVPPKGATSNIDYGPSPQDVICPAYNTATSQNNRSDAAEVIYRFRQLSPDDQQAVIEFLKQL
jgi:Di-haem oxidoreductase, putative peroxidase